MGQVLHLQEERLASATLRADVDVTHLLHLQKVQPEGSNQTHPEAPLPPFGALLTVPLIEEDGRYQVCHLPPACGLGWNECLLCSLISKE